MTKPVFDIKYETQISFAKYFDTYNSPLGKMMLESDGSSLLALFFEGQKYFNERKEARRRACSTDLVFDKNLAVFAQAKNWLDIYFSGTIPDFSPPLLVQGSNFRLDVWQEVAEINYGNTVTYGEIANKVAVKNGRPKMSARAVGGAVGHNPIALIVPCHRVLGSAGKITGYGGGIWRKLKLLELEKIDLSKISATRKHCKKR